MGWDGTTLISFCFLQLQPHIRPFTDRESFSCIKYLQYHFDTPAATQNRNGGKHSKYNVALMACSASVSTLYGMVQPNGNTVVKTVSITFENEAWLLVRT